MEDRENDVVFLRKPDATKARDQKLQDHRVDIGDVELVRIVFYLRLDKEKEPESWKKLHMGGIDAVSCQHDQLMMTNLLQEALGVAGGQKTNV